MRKNVASLASIVSILCLLFITACQPAVSPQAAVVESVKNLTADKPTMTTMNLTWDAVEGAETYKVTYKTIGSYSYATADTVSSAQCLVIGLTANKEYDFCVEAYAGTKLLASSKIKATTLAVSTPENIVVSKNDAGTSITITYNRIPQYTRNYIVYRSESETGPWTAIYEGTATTYTDSSPQKNLPYYYCVSAFVSDSTETDKSLPVRVVLSPDNTPKNLKVSSTLSTLTLSWDPVDGAVSYSVDMDDYESLSSPDKTESIPAGTTSWTITDIRPNVTKWFRVCAQTTYKGAYSKISGKTEDLSVTSLAQTASGSKSISISWSTSPITVPSNNVVFDVYRSSSSYSQGTIIASNLTAMAYTDSDTQLGISRYYYYTVVPRIKSMSTEYTELKLKCGTQAYVKPGSFSASAAKRTECSLSWDAVAEAGVTSSYSTPKYIVSYRKKGIESNYTEKSVSTANCVLSGLSPDTEYEAYVFVRDDYLSEAIAGETTSILSFKTRPAFASVSASSITLSEQTNTNPSKTTIRVSWLGVADAAKYEISCRVFAGRSMKLVHTTADASVTTADIPLNAGNRYQFVIKAYDSIETSVTSLSDIQSIQSAKIASESEMATVGTLYYKDADGNLTTDILDLMNNKTWNGNYIPHSTSNSFNLGIAEFGSGSFTIYMKASMNAEMLASAPEFIYIDKYSSYTFDIDKDGIKERFGAGGYIYWVDPTLPATPNNLNFPYVYDSTSPSAAGLEFSEEAVFNNALYLRYRQIISATDNAKFGVSFLY